MAVRRTEQRRAAIWALYQSDLLGRPLEQTFPRDTHAFTRAVAQLVRGHQAELDELIRARASGWSLERIAPLERSILRVGLAELVARYPLRQGVAELVTYLSLRDEAFAIVYDEQHRDQITWSAVDGRERTATLPRVTYARRGG